MRGFPGLLAARLPFQYCWVILGTICSVGFARQGAAVATLSIFVAPMTLELGWSQTEISGAASLGGLMAAFVSPVVGPMVDRKGSRVILAWSIFVMGGTCLLLAGVDSLLMFYVLFCMARCSFAGPMDLGMYGALNNWFVRLRPIATSILTLWLMIGLTLMPLIAHFAMQAGGGWRWGWIAVGGTVLIMGLVPTLLLLVRRPEDMGQVPDGGAVPNTTELAAGEAPTASTEPAFTRAQAIRTRAFWSLMVFTFLAFPVQAGVSLHQAPYLLEQGIDPTTAAFVVSWFSAMSGVAGFLVGPIVRPLGVRFLLVVVGGLLAAGCVMMMWVEGPVMAYAAATVFGFGIGGLLTVPPIAWADTFGRRSFGAIRGVALSVQVTGQAMGPVLSGFLRDVEGDYMLALQVSAGLAVASTVAIMFLKAPTRPDPEIAAS